MFGKCYVHYTTFDFFRIVLYCIAAYSKWHGTPEGTFSFLFLSCAHKLLTRYNNIITRLNDLSCRTHKLIILF